jgi:hypothetical protein
MPHAEPASAPNSLGRAPQGETVRQEDGGLERTITAHLFLIPRCPTFIWPSRGRRERKSLCSVQPVTST